MKLAKSLLLGSAAAIAAAAGAQAADLPSKKAAPVAYVQICDAYGAGFWYIPGTDICLKVGGIVQARYSYTQAENLLSLSQTYKQAANTVTTGFFTPTSAYAQNYQFAKTEDTTGTYMRTYLSLDARDQTPYGTLRTYILISLITYGGQAFASGTSAGAFAAPSPQTTNIGSGFSGTLPSISQGIIQFAGITAGRAATMSGFYKEANQWGSLLLEESTTTDMLAYTGTFGGGFSATLSIEDQNAGHSPGVAGLDQNIFNYVTAAGGPTVVPGVGTLIGHNGIVVAHGGYVLPDLVGVLRLDQAWGAVQLAGAVHDVTTTALTGTAPAGTLPIGGTPPIANPGGTPALVTPPLSKSEVGYGVVGGIEFNLPQLAAGDQLWLQAAYANGAIDYAGVNTSNDGNLSTDDNFGATRLLGGLMRWDRDAIAVLNPAGTAYILEKEQASSVIADFLHYWTPSLRSNLYGGWTNVTPGNITRHTDWTEGGLSAANEYRIGGNLIWTASRGFDIGVDVMYTKLNQKLTSNPGFAPTPLPVNLAGNPIVAVSPSAFQATLRLQRTF